MRQNLGATGSLMLWAQWKAEKSVNHTHTAPAVRTKPRKALKKWDGVLFSNALKALKSPPYVSVASGERSFSKQKLTKNFLCSTLKQDRLNGLAMRSSEHELAQEIEVENAIKTFAALKACRVCSLACNVAYMCSAYVCVFASHEKVLNRRSDYLERWLYAVISLL